MEQNEARDAELNPFFFFLVSLNGCLNNFAAPKTGLFIKIIHGISSDSNIRVNAFHDRNMCHLCNKGQRAESRGLEDFDLWTSKYSAD